MACFRKIFFMITKHLSHSKTSVPDDEHFDIQLKQEMQHVRSRHCRLFCQYCIHLIPPMILTNLLVAGDGSWGELVRTGTLIVNYSLIRWLAGQEHISPVFVDLLGTLIFVVVMFRTIVLKEDVKFFYLGASRFLIRLFAMLLQLNHRKTLPMLILSSAVTCWAYSQNVQVFRTEALPTTHVRLFCAFELLSNLGLLLLVLVIEGWCEGRVRDKLEAEGARRAVHKILTVVCDAVIDLDSDFSIAKPTPQLAHVLLRHGDSFLKGTSFHDLIATDADRERFLAFIRRSSGSAGPLGSQLADSPPSVLHLNLESSDGSALSVELFHAGLPTADGQVGHVLGVRVGSNLLGESSTQVLSVESKVAAKIWSPATTHSPQDPGMTTGNRPKSVASSRVSRSSACSWIQEESFERIEVGELAELTVCFNAMSERLSVMDFTMHFAQRNATGVLLPDLVDCMCQASNVKLRRLVQESLRSRPTPVAMKGVGLKLIIPFFDTEDVFLADSAVVAPDDVEFDDDPDDEPFLPVTLRLRGFIRLRRTLQFRRRTDGLSNILEHTSPA